MIFSAYRFLLIISCCLFFVSTTKGQGCCSGGAPLTGNLALTPIETGVVSLQLIYDLNNLGSVITGSDRLDDRTRTRLTHTGLLKVDYEFHPRWAISGLFTFVRQTEKVNFGSIENTIFGQGLGDMVLIGRYNLLNQASQTLSLGAGVKLPTGSISRINQGTSLLLPPDLQPGTGAWDFIAISQFDIKHLLFIRNLNLSANATFRYTTDAARFQQQQLYKFGNIFQASLGVNYNVYLNNLMLTPQLSLRYRYALADQTDGFQTINTGGHWIYAIGRVETVLNKNFSFNANVEIPVFWRLEGVQLTTSFKLTVGMAYSFYTKKEDAEKQKPNPF